MRRKVPTPLDARVEASARRALTARDALVEADRSAREDLDQLQPWSPEYTDRVQKHLTDKAAVTEKLAASRGADDLASRVERAAQAAAAAQFRSEAAAAAVLEKRREKARQATANLSGSQRPEDRAPVKRLFEVWKGLMATHFPDLRYAPWWLKEQDRWKPTKEAGQAGTFVKLYGLDLAVKTIQYVFGNWGALKERFKQRPDAPTIGWVMSLASTFTIEVQSKRGESLSAEGKLKAAQKAISDWLEANPSKSSPPDELTDALKAAQAEVGRKGGR